MGRGGRGHGGHGRSGGGHTGHHAHHTTTLHHRSGPRHRHRGGGHVAALIETPAQKAYREALDKADVELRLPSSAIYLSVCGALAWTLCLPLLAASLASPWLDIELNGARDFLGGGTPGRQVGTFGPTAYVDCVKSSAFMSTGDRGWCYFDEPTMSDASMFDNAYNRREERTNPRLVAVSQSAFIPLFLALLSTFVGIVRTARSSCARPILRGADAWWLVWSRRTALHLLIQLVLILIGFGAYVSNLPLYVEEEMGGTGTVEWIQGRTICVIAIILTAASLLFRLVFLRVVSVYSKDRAIPALPEPPVPPTAEEQAAAGLAAVVADALGIEVGQTLSPEDAAAKAPVVAGLLMSQPDIASSPQVAAYLASQPALLARPEVAAALSVNPALAGAVQLAAATAAAGASSQSSPGAAAAVTAAGPVRIGMGDVAHLAQAGVGPGYPMPVPMPMPGQQLGGGYASYPMPMPGSEGGQAVPGADGMPPSGGYAGSYPGPSAPGYPGYPPAYGYGGGYGAGYPMAGGYGGGYPMGADGGSAGQGGASISITVGAPPASAPPDSVRDLPTSATATAPGKDDADPASKPGHTGAGSFL